MPKVNIPLSEKNLLLSSLKLHLRSEIHRASGHQITRVKAVSLRSLIELNSQGKMFPLELESPCSTNKVSDASILNFLLEMFLYAYYGPMFSP